MENLGLVLHKTVGINQRGKGKPRLPNIVFSDYVNTQW